MRQAILRVTLVTLVATTACTSAREGPGVVTESNRRTPPTSNFTGAQEILVTRPSSSGPEKCHPESVGRLVVDFFAAVNRGDTEQAVDFFTDDLGWYCVTEGNPRHGGRHFVAYKPARFRSYLADRAEQDERMYLVSMDVAYEGPGNVANVAYTLQRTADDLKHLSSDMGGKGAIDCDEGRIAVWSMAQRKQAVPGKMCPGQPDPPRVALVCARKRGQWKVTQYHRPR